MEQFRQETVRQRVFKAIDRFVKRDALLLRNDCNERSITHRLAMYLQDEFDGWDVDCEYNRDHHYIKRLYLPEEPISTSDTNAKTVFPDIIVHHRGTSDNLLVIEVKKSTNPESDERDEKKLRAFKEQLRYAHALFLRFCTGRNFITVQTSVVRELWIETESHDGDRDVHDSK